MSTQETVIKTAGLTKIFRDFWLREKVSAVSKLDLEIYNNEVFGLLGPNGSGKSTTLKMILGLLFPTSGSISILNSPPTNVAVKSRMGFLPEDSNLYPFLDARETLDFYGKLFKIPRKQRMSRIDMLIDMVGLARAAYRRVGEYSKGMQRRIGLAQALINDPDLLILDEPTSGLDPIGTLQFKELIRTLADRGKTVILSSHLLADCEDVCDRVAILYGGVKRAEGSISQLLAKKDQTQITASHLSENTIAEIRSLIEKSGAHTEAIDTPRDKLESLFMKIVEDATRENLKTGGATAGGVVAEFLQQEQGENLVESLVSGTKAEKQKAIADETAQAEKQMQRTDKAQANQDLLSDLVTPKTDLPEPTQTETPVAPSQNADRSLIEGLMGNESDETSSEDK